MSDTQHTLIVSVNWIGDAVMAMPAVQAYRAKHPNDRISVLAKPSIAPLWRIHPSVDDTLVFESGLLGTIDTIQRLRKAPSLQCAYIMPHSFRSALIPFLARLPQRVGLPGDLRHIFVHEVVHPKMSDERRHQQFEYMDLLVPSWPSDTPPPSPILKIPDDVEQDMNVRLSDKSNIRVGLVPGAARGPSKQWPAEHFIALGQRLVGELETDIVVAGTAGERVLCEQVAGSIGTKASSWAGHTNLYEWLALLAACDVVVANDSGAMHIATAIGRPVVALYGITDPATTGPLGDQAIVLQHSKKRHRDVPRDSAEAREALAAIMPEEVYEAVRQAVGKG